MTIDVSEYSDLNDVVNASIWNALEPYLKTAEEMVRNILNKYRPTLGDINYYSGNGEFYIALPYPGKDYTDYILDREPKLAEVLNYVVDCWNIDVGSLVEVDPSSTSYWLTCNR